jgi:uncharacterized protein (TIGR02145 family)
MALIVKDVEGNEYQTVEIGKQVWMAENLRTGKYNDGTSIPLVESVSEWSEHVIPAYSWYNNDINNGTQYGALYNWYAVESGKLAPNGWHVPTEAEIWDLKEYVVKNGLARVDEAGRYQIGKALASQLYWKQSAVSDTIGYNPENNNNSGFGGLPAGFRAYIGGFCNFGENAKWWTATEKKEESFAMYFGLWFHGTECLIEESHKSCGFSVRLLQD